MPRTLSRGTAPPTKGATARSLGRDGGLLAAVVLGVHPTLLAGSACPPGQFVHDCNGEGQAWGAVPNPSTVATERDRDISLAARPQLVPDDSQQRITRGPELPVASTNRPFTMEFRGAAAHRCGRQESRHRTSGRSAGSGRREPVPPEGLGIASTVAGSWTSPSTRPLHLDTKLRLHP